MSRMRAQPQWSIETGATDPRQPSPRDWLAVIPIGLRGTPCADSVLRLTPLESRLGVAQGVHPPAAGLARLNQEAGEMSAGCVKPHADRADRKQRAAWWCLLCESCRRFCARFVV